MLSKAFLLFGRARIHPGLRIHPIGTSIQNLKPLPTKKESVIKGLRKNSFKRKDAECLLQLQLLKPTNRPVHTTIFQLVFLLQFFMPSFVPFLLLSPSSRSLLLLCPVSLFSISSLKCSYPSFPPLVVELFLIPKEEDKASPTYIYPASSIPVQKKASSARYRKS